MINLDMKCAKAGRDMIDKGLTGKKSSEQENIVQKSLGVLLENGPYAMYIFCKSKDYSGVNKYMQALFSDEDIQLGESGPLDRRLESIANDLETLLFAKNLMERILTYARYHAKASGQAKF